MPYYEFELLEYGYTMDEIRSKFFNFDDEPGLWYKYEEAFLRELHERQLREKALREAGSDTKSE